MNAAARSIAFALTSSCALLAEPRDASAQAIVDAQNKYSNVGVIMVWLVDAGGKPIELRAFASGTLIRDRVMITAGHFTAPAKALGQLPPSVRLFASFSPTEARNPATWIPVVALATHPSMPLCPPPPQCDPTEDLLVAPLEPGIADIGLAFLARAPIGIEPAGFAEQGALDRSEGVQAAIVGYGTLTPQARGARPDTAAWDGKRRVRTSTLRKVVDETWSLWSIPSYVCSGDSGGAIFLSRAPNQLNVLVANVSDGGRDCRRHNNNIRLDTKTVQDWIDNTIIQQLRGDPSLVRS
jgi:hypothetical protein